MIEASQRMIGQQNSSAVNKHFKLQIKTLLQNALRDADDKLECLLQVKHRQKDEAMHMEDTQKG
jgi:hypothetical protein